MTYRDTDALHSAGARRAVDHLSTARHAGLPTYGTPAAQTVNGSRPQVLVDASWHRYPTDHNWHPWGHAVVAAVHVDEVLHRLELQQVGSSMHAEMLAIRHGLGAVHDLGWQRAIVVTDNRVCELLANRPGQGGGGPHLAEPLRVVRNLLQLMPDVQVVWAKRALVRAAHMACRR